MDTAAIEKRGIEPAKADLAAIAAAKTHEDIAKLSGGASFRANLPIGMGVTLDAKRPDVYIVAIGQGGLGMPDRDYYLKDDAKFADARAKYRTYVESMLKLAGDAQAAANADSIVAVEKSIAVIHWPREKSRDRDLTYNPKNRTELLAFAPEFPWEARLTAFGAPAHRRVHRRPAGRGAVAGQALPRHTGGDLACLPDLPLPERQLRRAAEGVSTTRHSTSTARRSPAADAA